MDKTLLVPHIPELDNEPTEAIMATLESKGARQSIEALNWRKQYSYKPLSTFTVAHTATHIYIDFFVRCNYLRAANYLPNTPVGDDSSVEILLKTDPDTQSYWSFAFNCIGTVNAAYCDPDGIRQPLPEKEIRHLVRYASCGKRPFEEIQGLFTWNILVEIPLNMIGLKWNGQAITLSGNVCKCASATSQPHFISWSPILTPEPDFNRPEFFAPIILDK